MQTLNIQDKETPTRIVLTGEKGTLTLTAQIDEEGFPVIDIHFNDGKGCYFMANADGHDRTYHVPLNKDMCVTLGA